MRLRLKERASLNLDYGQIVTIIPEGEQPTIITCDAGMLWITIAGKNDDLLLRAGSSISLVPGRLTVIQALEQSIFVLVGSRVAIAA